MRNLQRAVIVNGSALALPIADKTVQCVVTSPPYFGLREYGNGAAGIGLEKSFGEYLERMVAVFDEVWRVLRDDGVLWLNMGDSYNNRSVARRSSHQGGLGFESDDLSKSWAELTKEGRTHLSNATGIPGMKEKDLVGQPWRLAFALQERGWYLRSDVIWAKPNPMPESIRDRPTKAHEYVFLLTKSPRYFYDSDAVRGPAAPSSLQRIAQPTFDAQLGGPKDYANGTNSNRSARKTLENFRENPGRNLRTVWSIPTEAFSEAHFATFPKALVEPCIRAGTSERGACASCGAPYVREVESNSPGSWHDHSGRLTQGHRGGSIGREGWENYERRTTGWRQSCGCGSELEADDLEVVWSPVGEGGCEDPSISVGRAGMARPRADDEARRPMTRFEQRHIADQIKASPHYPDMAVEAGPAVAHYTRKDRAGARPVPPALLEVWVERGWVFRIEPPVGAEAGVRPCVVLDPFAGSGTTGVVAAKLGRSFVGVELNAEYCGMARDRVRAEGRLMQPGSIKGPGVQETHAVLSVVLVIALRDNRAMSASMLARVVSAVFFVLAAYAEQYGHALRGVPLAWALLGVAAWVAAAFLS